jgi:hypothetical protein
MTALVQAIRRYVSLNELVSERIAKLSRAWKRLRRHKRLRQAKYPWNAAVHRIRWLASDSQSISAWTDRQLALGQYRWVFIAGCNNSGTTLLSRVLGSHPRVRALPREGQTLTRAIPKPTDLGVSRLFTKRIEQFRWTEDSDPYPALRARYDWSRYFDDRPGHLLVKSPENTLRTRWLQRHFEPSSFVMIVRSPYAVCEGTRRRSGHSIEDAAEHWTKVNHYLIEDMRHLDHSVLFKYEDFCQRPEDHLTCLQRFMELMVPFSGDALRPQEVHNIDGSASPIRDFNAKSIARLSSDDIATINRIAGPVMAMLGYEQIQKSTHVPVISDCRHGGDLKSIEQPVV